MKKLLLGSVITLTLGFHYRALDTMDSGIQPSELIFSHEFHVEEQELDCGDCHSEAGNSTTGLDDLLPDMDVCEDCHDVDDDETCNMCHSNVDDITEIARIDRYSEKFSHERHITNGLDCSNCHETVAQKTTVDPYILPEMFECVECHEQNAVSNDCLVCHVETDELKPWSHTDNFIHAHGELAQADLLAATSELSCATCHDSSFCEDCHEGDNIDRLTHPLNFEFTHALNAQGQELLCASCHTETTFCIDCHRDNQVLPLNHRPGWANTLDGGRHRFEAINDLGNCMACHEENAETVCQPCHDG